MKEPKATLESLKSTIYPLLLILIFQALDGLREIETHNVKT